MTNNKTSNEAAAVTQHLLNVYRQLYNRYNEFAAQFDLTATQLASLDKLSISDGMTVGELGQIIGIERSSATGFVNRMVAKKLIVKYQDQTDKRLMRIYLTTNAKKKLEAKKSEQYSFSRTIGAYLESQLISDEITQLNLLLQTVGTALEKFSVWKGKETGAREEN
ncbi:MAG: MarR family transcriptional regulator [Thermincola sp.]|jgi:DNA-binding MarR family transcriptional regulator|nr:MarR family transcriptional regulator [Thermincola sp.]MDT3703221.1 MarR family transcriptional regulator [Thermincola sp.]